MTRTSTWFAYFPLALALSTPPAGAAPGAPDLGFGTNGKAVVAFNLGGDRFDAASDVAYQSDGQAVVLGHVQLGATDFDLALVRVDAQGNLDASFGTNGATTVFFDLGQGLADFASALAILPDDSIVAVGNASTAIAGNADIIVARLLPDGALDPTFDADGKAVVTFDLGGAGFDFATDVAVQPDGKIVLVGTATDATGTSTDCVAARLLPGGGLDDTFDGDGKVVVSFDLGGDLDDECMAMVLQPDGKIVLGGKARTADGFFDMALARLTTTGALDATFGSGGRTTFAVAPNSDDQIHDMALMADGRLVVGGQASSGTNYDFAVARLTTSGALDASFNVSGHQTVDFVAGGAEDHFETARGVAVQPDGKIVLGGQVYRGSGNFDYGIARFESNGALDIPFGPGGTWIVAFNLGQNFSDSAQAMAMGPSGGFLIVGFVEQATSGDYDFGLAQFLGDAVFADGFESGDTAAWDSSAP